MGTKLKILSNRTFPPHFGSINAVVSFSPPESSR